MEPASTAAKDRARYAGQRGRQGLARGRRGSLSGRCGAGMAGQMARQSKGSGEGIVYMNGFLGRPPVKGGRELASGGLVFRNRKPPAAPSAHDPLIRGSAA